jgi:hypothetical protein
MPIQRLLKVLFFISSIACISGAVFAAGTTAGDFLLVDVNARETGMGGIYAPFYGRPSAAIANPGCLQGVEEKQFIFSHFTSVFGTNYEQAIYAQPRDKNDSVGVMFMYDADPGLNRTDSTGVDVQSIENYDLVAGLIYSMKLAEDFDAGINLKFVASRIFKTSTYGAVANFGLLHKNFDKKYLIGASLENVGVNASDTRDKTLFPMLFRGGYGLYVYRNGGDRIALYAEEKVFLIESQGTETSLGTEVTYQDFFSFRAGYVFGKDEGRIAVGAGLIYGQVSVDYAYQPYFVADNVHHFTVTLKF